MENKNVIITYKKKDLRRFIFGTILCFCLNTLFGQNDSLLASNEQRDSANIKSDRIYTLFLKENNREIKHLFKLNLIGLRLLDPAIAYEQKLGKSFSCETGIHFGMTNLNNTSGIKKYIYYEGIFSTGYYIGGYETIKYYYNLNRRKRLGKNANGFSGNYIAINYTMHYREYKNSIINSAVYHYGGITYGLQRRIGNIGYIEPSMTLILRPKEGTVYGGTSLNLKMGFAIESISSLRRMLKK